VSCLGYSATATELKQLIGTHPQQFRRRRREVGWLAGWRVVVEPLVVEIRHVEVKVIVVAVIATRKRWSNRQYTLCQGTV